LNVQGIRNKKGEIIKGLEELRQDIAFGRRKMETSYNLLNNKNNNMPI
jgi:hypothetical protein